MFCYTKPVLYIYEEVNTYGYYSMERTRFPKSDTAPDSGSIQTQADISQQTRQVNPAYVRCRQDARTMYLRPAARRGGEYNLLTKYKILSLLWQVPDGTCLSHSNDFLLRAKPGADRCLTGGLRKMSNFIWLARPSASLAPARRPHPPRLRNCRLERKNFKELFKSQMAHPVESTQ